MNKSPNLNQFIYMGEIANSDEFAHLHKLSESDLARDDDKLLTHSNVPVYTSKHTDHTYARLWSQAIIDNKNEQVTVKQEKSEDFEYYNDIGVGQYSVEDTKPTIADSEYDDPEQSPVFVNLIEIVPQVSSISDTEDKVKRSWFNESTTLHKTPPEQSRISFNSLNSTLHKRASVTVLNRLSLGHQNEVNGVNSTSSENFDTTSSLMYPVVRLIRNQCYICKTSFASNCSLTYPVHVCRNDPLTRNDRAIIGSLDNMTNNMSITTDGTIKSHGFRVPRKEFYRKNNLWKRTTLHEKNEARAFTRGFDPSNSSHSIGHAETVSGIIENPLDCTLRSYSHGDSSQLPTHRSFHSYEEQFACAFCLFRCKRKGDLSTHVRCHSGETPLTCALCPFQCWMSYKLSKHMRCHGDEKSFACTMCSYRCSENRHLVRHMHRHADDEKLACAHCSYKCKRSSSLVAHRRKRHSDDKRVACPQCPYRCSYRYQLSKHLRRHTGENPLACNLCSYRCNESCRLRAHMRTHTGEMEFACERCPFRCSKKIYLTKHAIDHASGKEFRGSGEKEFLCTVCPYRSRIRREISEHTRIHSDEKPFGCAHCPYRCSQRCSLSVHMRRHSDEKPFACEICPKRYKGKNALLMHMLSHIPV